MNFPLLIIDESVDARLLNAWWIAGYDVYSIQQEMQGMDDRDIIELAISKAAFIITEDKDFGDEIVRKRTFRYGALLLRLHGVPIEEKIRLLITSLQNHREELLRAFSVLNKNKLRIRSLQGRI